MGVINMMLIKTLVPAILFASINANPNNNSTDIFSKWSKSLEALLISDAQLKIKGQLLNKRWFSNGHDSYFELYCNGDILYTSETIKNEDNPEWREFPLRSLLDCNDVERRLEVHFDLYDEDFMSNNDHLGISMVNFNRPME